MHRTLASLLLLALLAGSAPAQSLADYDYENLNFRGIGIDYGRIWPNKVDPTASYAVRVDLGYLGPAVRIVPTAGYWRSTLSEAELARFADRLAELPALQRQGVRLSAEDFGRIRWSSLGLGIDAHLVWTTPFRLLTFVGAGSGVQFMNGRGDAIDGTFVEDLLDSVTAGVALLAGAEVPVSDRLRIYGEARYALTSDVRYPALRIGAAVMRSGREPLSATRGRP